MDQLIAPIEQFISLVSEYPLRSPLIYILGVPDLSNPVERLSNIYPDFAQLSSVVSW